MTLTDWKDVATIVGVLVAAATLLKGLGEYRRQVALDRAGQIAKMKQAFVADPAVTEICRLLDANASLAEVPIDRKRVFLCFFEEAALLLNSRLVTPATVYWLFGYYAVLCERNDSFWTFPSRDDPHWDLFHEFARQMITIHDAKNYDRPAFIKSLRA